LSSVANASVSTVVVDGLALAQELRERMAGEVAAQRAAGRRAPCLAVVLVGDDPASASYIKGKRRACERVGMGSVEHKLPLATSQADLLALIEQLNRDDAVDGILVQLPLPKQIHANTVAAAIDAAKDVDGVGPLNAGRLLLGESGLFPCTPLGILEILDRHGIALDGAHAVVIGRSMIVGKAVSLLLQRRNATVTMCHSRTRDLAALCVRGIVNDRGRGDARDHTLHCRNIPVDRAKVGQQCNPATCDRTSRSTRQLRLRPCARGCGFHCFHDRVGNRTESQSSGGLRM
jgi:methylenetetrahydrofolate dehydrogenase (NADP+)/methenyltetrahydrofolate cyclohydrolase